MKIQKAVRSAKYDDLIENLIQSNAYANSSTFDMNDLEKNQLKISDGERLLMTWAAIYMRDFHENNKPDRENYSNITYDICYDYVNEYAKIFGKTVKNNKLRQIEFYKMLHNMFSLACAAEDKNKIIFKIWLKQIFMTYELDFCHSNFLDTFFTCKPEINTVKKFIYNICLDIVNEKLQNELSITTKNYYKHCHNHLSAILKSIQSFDNEH